MKPIGRHRTGRLVPPLTVTLLSLVMALAACDPNGLVDTSDAAKGKASGGPSTAPSTAASGHNNLNGGINDPGATPRPSGNPTGKPTASPTATAAPTPTPSPTPTAPPATAVSVRITPSTNLVLHLPPPAGATPLPGMPSTLALEAEVTLSSGALDAQAPTWETSDAAIATVSASGQVGAVSRTGTATITAISADALASASVTVTVKSVGNVSVEVE